MLHPIINQRFVNLIADDPETVLLGQLHRGDDQLSRPHRAGGVVGGVEDHRLRAAGDGSGHLLRGGQKEICRISVDKNRNAARHADHFSVADPIRRGQNHLVAGVQDGLQCVIKHLLGACAHDDLPRVIAQSLLSQDMIGNRLAQLRDAFDLQIFVKDNRFLVAFGYMDKEMEILNDKKDFKEEKELFAVVTADLKEFE